MPAYLVIGHVTLDAIPDGFTVGGTATYSAVTASRLGWSARILTACSAQGREELMRTVPDAELACIEADTTTTFRNCYDGGRRIQRLLSVAPPLTPDLLPPAWLDSDVVHLGPVAREVADAFMTAFRCSATLGLTPQGWLRDWDEEGNVSPARWLPAPEHLRAADAVILSEDDVGLHSDLIPYYARYCRVVVTEGYRGSTIYDGSQRLKLNPRSTQEVDPTGAGDVFAAAFLIRLRETGDPVGAARFGNVAGSFSVEGGGVSTIPDRQAIERWLADHRDPCGAG